MCSEFLNTLSTIIANYPNYDNYVMSASALLRLQDTYDLETTNIANGLVGSAFSSPPSMSGTYIH